jgi:hypothetical protein
MRVLLSVLQTRRKTRIRQRMRTTMNAEIWGVCYKEISSIHNLGCEVERLIYFL